MAFCIFFFLWGATNCEVQTLQSESCVCV